MTATLADTMFFRQYYLGCLSHASYLVGDTSTGVAAVIDPQRDVAEYLADAEAHGLTIRYVLETHFHADFLSGHLELAAATGATIGYGRAAEGRAEFPIVTYSHGDRITLGRVELEVLETPGHTPESISIVVRPDKDSPSPYGVLTGDTLFIGDVGRPDLLASVGVTADDLGRQLYHSLHDTLLALPDHTKVFPAHGAGSACGKNLSTETVSTIGEQRTTNYALAPMSENEFVEAVTEGQSIAPMYFQYAATMNRRSRDLLAEDASVTRLDISEVLAHQATGAVVIDARTDAEFAQGHLRGSVNVGLGGRFAEYAGEVMTPGTPIVLVVPPGHESEATIRLARIGFDNVLGALHDPTRAFVENPQHVEMASRLRAAELASRLSEVEGLVLVDVRNPGEVALGTITGALHVSLPSLINRLDELDPSRPTVVFCAGGYRSSIARSFLRSRGFTDVSDVVGGYTAWAAYQQMQSAAPASTPAVDVDTVAADADVYLFDVREQEEWDAGHVDGAVHIPMGEVVSRLAELPRDRRIVCMCRSGNRSGRVTVYLRGQGLDVVNLTGGALQWNSAGHALVDSSGAAGTVS